MVFLGGGCVGWGGEGGRGRGGGVGWVRVCGRADEGGVGWGGAELGGVRNNKDGRH